MLTEPEVNNCLSVIAQVFSLPFCYNCFDYSYRDKLEFNRFIQLNQHGGTPNLVTQFVFFRNVVCSIAFIISYLTLAKCKAAILKFKAPAIVISR